METIYKKISLEDFKNRFSDSGETFGTKWGKTVLYDYDLEEYRYPYLFEVSDRIPAVQGKVRFGNLIALHTWLTKDIETSEFYQLCYRRGAQAWVEYVEGEEDEGVIDILSEIPDANDSAYTIGDIIWVCNDAERIKETFLNSGETTMDMVFERIEEFFDFYEKAKNSVGDEDAYFDVSVMLTESCYNIGMYTSSGETIADFTNPEITEITAITATTESRLSGLRRHKRSVDDNGNELPFIVDNNGELGIILKEGDPDPVGKANSGFITGVTYNMYTEGDKTFGDYVSAVTTSVTSITITYVIGAEINGNPNTSAVTYSGGVTYIDRYPLSEEKTLDFLYDEEQLTAVYKDILYDSQYEKFGEEKYAEGKRYAEMSFDPRIQIKVADTYFKDESLMELDDVQKSGEAPRVERGTAAAFELHNILGECRTMDDLEKYRNNFFSIRDDEKQ